ncbi:hypothetical protein ACFPYI_05910 [Halomarina salina]|uniref:Uncharacterized protein n=1 Tax=Halomarina salina TaxID=1872699 RepID=A0ABD5RKY7_9EURY|nr:hypothetical protein [Halomarina salina]
MRRITRNVVLVVLAVLVLLLALGALPSLLRSGDPYYLTAQTVENGSAPATVNATALSERRFPYTTAALDSGRSDAYYDGPLGLKEAFTHSPFDELSELAARNASAVENRTGFVTRGNATYRLELVRGEEAANATGSVPRANATNATSMASRTTGGSPTDRLAGVGR